MILVKDCKACGCTALERQPGRFGVQNRGPFFCSADPLKEQIKYLPKCPKGKVQNIDIL